MGYFRCGRCHKEFESVGQPSDAQMMGNYFLCGDCAMDRINAEWKAKENASRHVANHPNPDPHPSIFSKLFGCLVWAIVIIVLISMCSR